MPWDGVKRYHFGISDANWNCDTNLDEALAYKTDWYFQNVSDLVRTKNYDFFLKYLNVTDLSYRKKEKYYWHFGGLESTPEQQIQFLRKLKDKKFYFRKENQEYLYSQMLQVSNPKYKIYGYETYNVFKGERIDWWVGVLETKDNNYFFSTRVYEDVNKEEKKDFLTKKFLITIEIFRLLGYI